jgi:hypothetical protein
MISRSNTDRFGRLLSNLKIPKARAVWYSFAISLDSPSICLCFSSRLCEAREIQWIYPDLTDNNGNLGKSTKLDCFHQKHWELNLCSNSSVKVWFFGIFPMNISLLPEVFERSNPQIKNESSNSSVLHRFCPWLLRSTVFGSSQYPLFMAIKG